MYRIAIRSILALSIAIVLVWPLSAQTRPSFDWDFTYAQLLERNKVGKDELIPQWLAGIKSPAEKWVTGWKGKPIISSILIEYPAFHAAERQTIWLVRTANEAHYWELTEAFRSTKWADEAEIEEPFSYRLYDAFYAQASAWKQLPPKPAEELPDQAFPGFMGFISLYGPDGSRQMLLTLDDFFICPNKICAAGQMKSGRLMAALLPGLTPESRKNYAHKTEAEIARMTPEQRIDEQILEDDNHLLDLEDKQSQLIRQYRRHDGLKASNHLIRLMDSYRPRSRDSRFSKALMIADEIDERIVRLRASEDGRKVITAMERLAGRLQAAGKSDSLVALFLRSAAGANIADGQIRDTLLLRHGIRMTDMEFQQFCQFMLEYDPTYPGWSERESVNKSPKITMKDSMQFYKAYLAFKKSRHGK